MKIDCEFIKLDFNNRKIEVYYPDHIRELQYPDCDASFDEEISILDHLDSLVRIAYDIDD